MMGIWTVDVPVLLYTINVLLVVFLHCYVSAQKPQDGDGLALTPPMGWNSWNMFVCDDLNETVVRETASILVSTQLAHSGYKYVNIDDCWQISRNSSGHIQVDPGRFPPPQTGEVMQVLGKYLHDQGLKFGIYTDVGTLTCQKRPGSYQFEVIDAQTYSSWGVDFVKNDDCFCHPSQDVQHHYTVMYNALHAAETPMIHSIKATVPIENASAISHMRRVEDDIGDDWPLMMHLIDVLIEGELWLFTKPGFWNDIDMLEIGNGGMTQDEYITHMALWCALKAPLLLGNDLSKMDDFTLKLLKHDEFLAINQDPLGKSAHLVKEYYMDGSLSKTRMVMRSCKYDDLAQQWTYMEAEKLLKHVQTGKCLTLEYPDSFRYFILTDCDQTNQNQLWGLDHIEGEIHPVDSPEICITLSRIEYGECKLRRCDERQHHLDWQGPDVHSFHGFQEKFSFVPIANKQNTYAFENKNRRCASIGGRPDILVFSGVLTDNQVVILVVNRDTGKHSVTVDFSEIPELSEGIQYSMRNAYTVENLGLASKSDEHMPTFELSGHQSLTLVLVELKNP